MTDVASRHSGAACVASRVLSEGGQLINELFRGFLVSSSVLGVSTKLLLVGEVVLHSDDDDVPSNHYSHIL